MEKVGYSEKYDIRKNMRDIFSIPKSRNKIIKDFKFNRLIDVETYSNFILEFYKLQKILFDKDLLLLFKKTNYNSIFNENTFSYYQFSINNNLNYDPKFSLNYDRSEVINNFIYHSMQTDYFHSKKIT